MSKTTDYSKSIETKIEIALTEINHIRIDVAEIKTRLENNYVTKTEFEPIKRVVYGLVSLVLTAVVMALIGLVLIK